MEIKELTIKNCEEVLSLWQSTEGVGLDRDVDTKERIGIYLQRNPGLSFAAFEKGKVLGAVLCGHDGRRGYLHHLTVAEAHRNCECSVYGNAIYSFSPTTPAVRSSGRKTAGLNELT